MFLPTWFTQAFDLWEHTTAEYLDGLMHNPAFLSASAAGASTLQAFKEAADVGTRCYLAWLGLPTREEQDRALRALQQIEKRLNDIQLQLESSRREAAAHSPQPSPRP